MSPVPISTIAASSRITGYGTATRWTATAVGGVATSSPTAGAAAIAGGKNANPANVNPTSSLRIRTGPLLCAKDLIDSSPALGDSVARSKPSNFTLLHIT